VQITIVSAKYLQGTALYKMRYGFVLAFLSALKLAVKKGRIRLLWDYLSRLHEGIKNKETFLINADQGIFVRAYRWKNIRRKFKILRLTIQFNSSAIFPILTINCI